MTDLMKLARAACATESMPAARSTGVEPPSAGVEPGGTTKWRKTTKGETDAPPLATCAACAYYTATPDKTPDGWCRKHRTETWGAYGGGCASDWIPADPASRTLERRRAAVVARLEADPALRYSFDVQGATPAGPADGPVLLGLRDSSGVIVIGELCIPADRWLGLAAFAEHWRKAAEGQPS